MVVAAHLPACQPRSPLEPVSTRYAQGAISMSDMINDLLDGNSKFVSGEFLPNENYYHAIAAK
jgi:hypothetical protein